MADPSITIKIDAAKLAREVAAELHRLENERIRRICDELAAERAAEAAEQQAADGLDDQDGPILRCPQYAAYDNRGDLIVWAQHGDHWWQVDSCDGEIGWYPTTDAPPAGMTVRLPGWAEIPQATTGTAISEEQTSA